jgi:hypothetical protein
MNRYIGQPGQQAQSNSLNTPDQPYALVLEVRDTTSFAQLEQFILKSFRRRSQTESSGSNSLLQTTSFVLAAREDTLPEPLGEGTLHSLAPEPGQTALTRSSAPLEPGFVLVLSQCEIDG